MSTPPSSNAKDFQFCQTADFNNVDLSNILNLYLFGGQLALHITLLELHSENRLETLVTGLRGDGKSATKTIALKSKELPDPGVHGSTSLVKNYAPKTVSFDTMACALTSVAKLVHIQIVSAILTVALREIHQHPHKGPFSSALRLERGGSIDSHYQMCAAKAVELREKTVDEQREFVGDVSRMQDEMDELMHEINELQDDVIVLSSNPKWMRAHEFEEYWELRREIEAKKGELKAKNSEYEWRIQVVEMLAATRKRFGKAVESERGVEQGKQTEEHKP